MKWWCWIIWGSLIWLMLNWFSNSVGLAEENDTAFTTNILPNAGTTTSGLTNSTLDGVQSGSTGALTNNSTHNGFTITCEVQVSSSCGNAFNGELEASHDMTVTASGSLVGIEGDSTPDGVTHTSTQIKLNGGINLSSSISVQNCEWNQSAYQCGNSVGVVDSYTIIMKVLDADENVLASSTQIRTTDSGYNLNAGSFDDSLHYNGVHANKYEWSWTGIDGSESTSVALRGPNLLGAEMILDFPIEDYEPLSAQEIKDMNEGLGTANLNESEIWNVISGLEESISEKLNVETGGAVTSVELTENFEIVVTTTKKAPPEVVAKVQEVVQTMNRTKTVETLKKEVIAEVIKESKQETKEEAVKEEPTNIAKNNKEPEKKEEASNKASTKVTKKKIKENKVKSKKTINTKLEKVMAKIDKKVKDSAKNLELKNIVKMDAMIGEQLSLALYEGIEFYKPKNIYMNQLNIMDDRQIYSDITLSSYVANDIIGIKKRQLEILDNEKQMLLIELEELKRG
jgi:outer membrane biosynthesis protein TonB